MESVFLKLDIITAVKMAKQVLWITLLILYNEEIGRTFAGKAIRAKTYGHQQSIFMRSRRRMWYLVLDLLEQVKRS